MRYTPSAGEAAPAAVKRRDASPRARQRRLPMTPRLREKWHTFAERRALSPDLGRATRATFAVIVPLLLAATGHLPLSVPFVAFAGQNVALVDVRGSYTLRLGLLLAMTAILAGASHLGALAAHSVTWMILGGGLIAAGGGLWRHLTPDYGASLAISSLLLFLIAIATPPAPGLAGALGFAATIGGGWGLLLQMLFWPVRPQHPLRRAVSDSWAAVADLFEALAPAPTADRSARLQKVESQLRTTLDQAYAALALPPGKPATPVRTRLGELNLAAARLATRVVALNTALESAFVTPAAAWLADAFQPVLTSLTNFSRSTAVTVVSRQPAHLAAFEVRLRRLRNLLRVFQEGAPARISDPATAAQLGDILRQIEAQLPATHEALRATVDRADERAAFSLELFDLHTWTLRPLASALNFRRQVNPALLRFTARLTVLTMLGIAAFRFLHLPHGYWLPLTTAIILQPDYGSTRQRAVQRTLGTLIGSLAASALLWLQLPAAFLVAATAATIFGFAFFLKRNYAIAVVFITLLVVLLTEAHEPVTLGFTGERLASTIAGGLLALIAAIFFWPVWERDRLPPILASALDANRAYLALIAQRLAAGGAYDHPAILAKRRAESTNAAVFSSLQRMMGDPQNQQSSLEPIAALANGNQRITRALTVMAVHLTPGASHDTPELAVFARLAADTLSQLEQAFRAHTPVAAHCAARLRDLPLVGTAPPSSPRAWNIAQYRRIATELGAMLLAVDQILAADAPVAAASAKA